MLIDLHIHTEESDGTYSPQGAVKAAKGYGLKAIAIADHDTIDGVEPAMAAGEALRVEVVPGVEINTDYGELEVHILGYYMDLAKREFLDLLAKLRQERIKRMEHFVKNLSSLGIDVELERVFEIAGKGSVGRPHLGRALMEKGYVSSLREAFEKYLDRGSPAYVERYKFAPVEAVRAIRDADGIPILAHPGLLKRDDLIPSLVEEGLMGIEVFHSEHTPADIAHYMAMAKEMGLLMTGGSDCHGPGGKDRVRMGTVRVPYILLERLKEAKKSIGSLNSL